MGGYDHLRKHPYGLNFVDLGRKNFWDFFGGGGKFWCKFLKIASYPALYSQQMPVVLKLIRLSDSFFAFEEAIIVMSAMV